MVDDIEPNRQWFGNYTPNIKVGVGLDDIHVEAENFVTNVGFQTQATSDVGGGLNIGFTDVGDYLTYDVEVGYAGIYQIISRIASLNNGASFDVLNGDTLLCSVYTPATGDYQAWQSFTNELVLPEGLVTLKILATGSGWNMNWFRLVPIDEPPPFSLPTVSFNTPTGTNGLDIGSDLYVKVDASDPDGIDRVRLYKDGVELARSEGLAPYEWGADGQNDPELQDLPPGLFVLTARAFDSLGNEAETSPGVMVVVGNGLSRGDNLIQNPSFETGDSSGWTETQPADTSVSSATAADGTWSVKYLLTTPGTVSPLRQTIAVEPNTDYTLTYQINYPVSGTTGAVTARITVNGVKHKSTTSSSTGGWTQKQIAFNSGPATSVTLDVYADTSFSGAAYVDDFSMTAPYTLTRYNIWAAENGLAGLSSDDDDGDGQINFLEYVLNGDPTNEWITCVEPLLTLAGGQLCYVHLRRNDDMSLLYQIETCTNLVSGTWMPSEHTVAGTDIMGGGIFYDEVTNDVPAVSEEAFLRLTVTAP